MVETRDYIHGAGRREQERLETQHRLIGGAAFLGSLRRGMSILEVGCGTGAIVREIAPRILPGFVTGVDLQDEQLSFARRLADERGIANAEFKRGRADSLDFPDDSFDLAYGRFLLEHVPDPLAVVSEMSRVTKSGGRVLACECQADCCSMTEPPLDCAAKAINALNRLQGLRGGDHRVARKLERIFLQAGLSDVRADPLEFRFEKPEEVRGYAMGAVGMLEASRQDLLDSKLISRVELDGALREWEGFAHSKGVVAWFRLARMQGIKP